MNKVLFLTEAGKNIGMGHFMRCCALADGFETYGVSSEFIIRGTHQSDFFFGRKVKFEEWFSRDELTALIRKDCIVVVDTYLADKSLLQYIATNFFTVFITDSTLNFSPSGMVLFPSVYAESFSYLKSHSENWIAGKDYILFDKMMWNLPAYVVREKLENIAIALGGFVSPELLKELATVISAQFPDVKITVLGKANSELLADHRINYEGMISKNEYLQQMYNTDLAITGAGMSLNECVLIGVPVISMAINKSQLANARAWEQAAQIDFLNAETDNWQHKLKILLTGIQTQSQRVQISKGLQKKIDGKGAVRAAKQILKLAEKQTKS